MSTKNRCCCQRSKPAHYLAAAFFAYAGHAVIVMSEHEDQICADSAKSFCNNEGVSNRPTGSRQCAGGKQDTAQAASMGFGVRVGFGVGMGVGMGLVAAAFHLHSPIASRRRNRQAGLTPGPAACLRSRDGRGVPLSRAQRWVLKCRRDRELGTPAHLVCGGGPSCGPGWDSAPTGRVTER